MPISKKLLATRLKPERVYLVGTDIRGQHGALRSKDSLKELADLARSAGAVVIGSTSQRLSRFSQTYLGIGKLEELKKLAERKSFDTIICDDELTPAQQRNIEDILDGVKVIDRTALILHVFANRARTREGRLQVELAQHQYLLPRLAGQWSHLERLGGGIGTRGPGESQLETDRRLSQRRIQKLRRFLQRVGRDRGIHRKRRRDQGYPMVSMVGYTNAGKSSLLNTLTGSDVEAENKLFSTLDPTTRKVRLPSGREVLVTDTVGFIQKQPPTVITAFKATLEEIVDTDVILHVIDMSHENADVHADIVGEAIRTMKIEDKPQILVLNKIDALKGGVAETLKEAVERFRGSLTRTVLTSATENIGIDALKECMDTTVSQYIPQKWTGI